MAINYCRNMWQHIEQLDCSARNYNGQNPEVE